MNNFDVSTNYKVLSPYKLDRSKVKVLIFQKDIQSKHIAEAKGISEATLSHNISGRGRNYKVQQAIADYLGVDLMDIVQELPQQSTAA